jgi:hypothetical protein
MVTTRILEDFDELVFLDDVSFDGHDRRAVYAMVDCHDCRMISKSMMVHVGGFWEQIFITVIDWATIDPLVPLKMTSSFCETERESLGLRIWLANP